jgi:peptide/nickel transport system substrate-binding protein
MSFEVSQVKRKLVVAIVAAVIIVLAASGAFYLSIPPKPVQLPTLRIALQSGFSTLDPANWNSQVDTSIDGQIYDSLWEYNLSMVPNPGLVTSWDVANDSSTWTLHLRQNVMFHDGTPFNASAVAFNLDRIRGAAASYYIEAISSWDVVDQYTIVLHTSRPFPQLIFHLAARVTSMVSPSAVAKWGPDFSRHPVGTGPFVFQEWVEGQYVKLVANPNYWGGTPKIAGVTFMIIPDASARYLALQSGAIDVDANPPVEVLPQVENSSTVHLIKSVTMRNVALWFNPYMSPFTDIRVREAIMHAIDKDAIVANVLKGYGLEAQGLFPPLVYGRVPDDTWGPGGAYPYDTSLAKQLLTQAGWALKADGFWYNATGSKLSVVLASPSGRYLKDTEISTAVVGYLGAIGIDATVRTYDSATLFKLVAAHSIPFYLMGWGHDPYPTVDTPALWHSSPGGGLPPWSAMSSPEMDNILDQIDKTTDPSQILTLYAQFEKMAMGMADFYPVYSAYALYGVYNYVKNLYFLANEDSYKMTNVTIEKNMAGQIATPFEFASISAIVKDQD